MIETLKVRPVTQADKEYSVLISVNAPFNLLLLFVAPSLIQNSQPQKLNTKLLLFAYLPVLIGLTLIFATFEVIMWPLVYLKMIFHKLTMVWRYSKSFRVSRADKFTHFLYWILIGPFVTIGNSMVDLTFFLRHLLQFDL